MACQPTVAPFENDPIFYLDFELDGQAQRWVAGDDGFFMFTQLGTSASGLQQFEGSLKSVAQPTSGAFGVALMASLNTSSFSLELWNANQPKPLYTSQLNTRLGVDLQVVLQPHFAAGEIPLNHIWRIEGPNTVFTTDLQPTIDVDLDNYPVYNIRLSVNYASGCSDAIVQRIDFLNLAARDDFAVLPLGTNQLFFERKFVYTHAGDTTHWWQGNNYLGTGTNFTQQPTAGAQQIVSMRVPLHSSQIFVQREFVPNATGIGGCFSFFDFQVAPHPDLDFFKPNHVLLTYTAPSGMVYSSALNSQGATVQLSDFEFFRDNAVGQPTARFKLAGNFALTASDGSQVVFQNCSGFLGVAIRN